MRKNFAEVLVYRCNLVKVWEWHPLETIFEQAQKLRKQFSVLVFHVVFLTDLYRKKKLTSENAIFAGFENDLPSFITLQIWQKCSKLL